jgi:hypothetical protein
MACTCDSSRSGAIFKNSGTLAVLGGQLALAGLERGQQRVQRASLCSSRRFLVLGLEMLTVT